MSIPLYYEARESVLKWQKSFTGNAGLYFDKFGNAWEHKDGKWTFNKSGNGQGETWLSRFAARTSGDRTILQDACQRQASLVRSMGGALVYVTNTTRFVTGMGRAHPLENGFAWHHTLGVPFLSGSGVKGVLRAWLREQKDPNEALFGAQGEASHIILLDMLPVNLLKLVVEVITPHYGPYYQEDETPGDWNSPVPISYLAVDAGAEWQLGLLPVPGRYITAGDINGLKASLLEALDWLGAGAKTATGYGQFCANDERTQKEELAAAEAARLEEMQRAHEKELSRLSPALALLHRRADAERWAEANDKLLAGLEKCRAENVELTAECIAWLRDEWIEKRWKGIWENPHAVEGKQQKPKFKPRSRNIVLWLKGKAD